MHPHFGLGSFGLHVSLLVALLAGITFNNAGYLAENFRGGLGRVPETQMKAARSLGMSAFPGLPDDHRSAAAAHRLLPTVQQMVWAVLMTSLG